MSRAAGPESDAGRIEMGPEGWFRMRDELKGLRSEVSRLRAELSECRRELDVLKAERRVMEATVESEHRMRMAAEDRANRRAR